MKRYFVTMFLSAVLCVGMYPSLDAFANGMDDHSSQVSSIDNGQFILARGGGSRGGGFSSSRSSSSRSSSPSRSSSSSSRSSSGNSKSTASKSWSKSSKSTPSKPAVSKTWAKPSSATTAKANKTWANTPKATQEKVAGGSLNGNRNTKSMSSAEKKADNAAFTAAKAKGTAFKSKAEASSAFKKTADTKYPSKFDKQPAKRPDYIPSTRDVGGKTVNINYNPGMGGYGYTDPITNAFVMYSVASMASEAHMNNLMMQQGYYVGTPVPMRPIYLSPIGLVIEFLIIIAIIICIVVFVKSN